MSRDLLSFPPIEAGPVAPDSAPAVEAPDSPAGNRPNVGRPGSLPAGAEPLLVPAAGARRDCAAYPLQAGSASRPPARHRRPLSSVAACCTASKT